MCDVDTQALGIFVITVHKASVDAADMNGKSGEPNSRDIRVVQAKSPPADPYTTISFAKYGKPLYSTRIIMNETEPVWENTGLVLVKADAFRAQERLALRELNRKGRVLIVS